MNPFTRFLRSRQSSAPAELDEFVTRWDALESLVINTYRAGRADAETEAAYAEIRTWLTRHYPAWVEILAPFWREALEAGKPPATDPFARLFAPATASAFVGNRALMQALPAAREALNRYLLTLAPGL
jgi:ABC-type glycerol-3-phosphate transport system substrate-binding protein